MKIDSADQMSSIEEEVSTKINGMMSNGTGDNEINQTSESVTKELLLGIKVGDNSSSGVNGEDTNLLKNGTEVLDLLSNGHSDSYSNGSPANAHLDDHDDDLSDISDESMNLHVTDDEDDPPPKEMEKADPIVYNSSSLTTTSNDTLTSSPIHDKLTDEKIATNTDEIQTHTEIDEMAIAENANTLQTVNTDKNVNSESNKKDDTLDKNLLSPISNKDEFDSLQEELDDKELDNENLDEEMETMDEEVEKELDNLDDSINENLEMEVNESTATENSEAEIKSPASNDNLEKEINDSIDESTVNEPIEKESEDSVPESSSGENVDKEINESITSENLEKDLDDSIIESSEKDINESISTENLEEKETKNVELETETSDTVEEDSSAIKEVLEKDTTNISSETVEEEKKELEIIKSDTGKQIETDEPDDISESISEDQPDSSNAVNNFENEDSELLSKKEDIEHMDVDKDENNTIEKTEQIYDEIEKLCDDESKEDDLQTDSTKQDEKHFSSQEDDVIESKEVLDEIDKILQDTESSSLKAKSETQITESPASSPDSTILTKRRKKKKAPRLTLQKYLTNKKIKMSKSYFQNLRKKRNEKRREEAELANATKDDDDDEIPLILRTDSSKTLDELAKVIAEDDNSLDNNSELSLDNEDDKNTSKIESEQDESNDTAQEKSSKDLEMDIDSNSDSKSPTDDKKLNKPIALKDTSDNLSKSNTLEENMEDSDIAILSDTETSQKLENETENKGKAIENSVVTSKKRSLESAEDSVDAKKPKIKIDEDIKQKIERKEFVPLDTFKDLLETKLNKLSRKNLEEFCIQKICEVLGQNSELGELRHQIKVQDQMLETWRNKVVAISKQTRDLEIVKCRLIQDMRTREREGGNISDTTPVKITRSVGLQVCLQSALGQRNRVPQPNTPQAQSVAPPPELQRRKSRVSLPNNRPTSTATTPTTQVQNKNVLPILPAKPPTPVKSVKTIPPRTPDPKETQTSLLNKALQKPGSTTNTPTNTPRKPPDAAPKAVIDLTDEDEGSKTTTTSTTTTTTVPSGVRIVASHQMVSSSAPMVSTSTPLVATSVAGPRLTYLVTPNGQQPQQVMLHTFATSNTPTRPGQVRANFMFKPLTANTVGTQRVNTIRLPNNSVQMMNQQGGRPSIRIGNMPTMTRSPAPRASQQIRHPAPLPGPPPLQSSQPNWKAMPPRPSLKISRVGDGIVLSWKILTKDLSHYEEIASYQLYAYQETNAIPTTEMWRKVGDVKALALPMACTLTQFTDGNKYHFAVRAVDVKSRVGPFSQPEQITLV